MDAWGRRSWALGHRTRRRIVGSFLILICRRLAVLLFLVHQLPGLRCHDLPVTGLMNKPAIRMPSVCVNHSRPLKPSTTRHTLMPSEPLSKTPTGGRFTFAPTAGVKTFYGPLHVVYRHPT
jgi:hypothetical protein